jgi:hypothetical protein
MDTVRLRWLQLPDRPGRECNHVFLSAKNSGNLFHGLATTNEGDLLSKRAVDITFQALYSLTDLRMILRETAPLHSLDNDQRIQALRLLENLERQVAALKQEMLK